MLFAFLFLFLLNKKSVKSSQVEQGVYSHLTFKIDELVTQPSQCDIFLQELEVITE